MLKKCTFCSLLIMFVSASPAAFADSTTYPYVGVTIGTPLTSVNKLSDSSGSLETDSNHGYMGGLTAGVAFDSWGRWNMEKIRVEAEIGYRSNELIHLKTARGQSVNVNSRVAVANFMLNGYAENTITVSNDIPVILFVTAGAGAAVATIDSISNQGATLVASADNTQFAYQAGAGFSYELTKKITLDSAYKYLGTTDFKFGGIKAAYGSHTILFGARYLFR